MKMNKPHKCVLSRKEKIIKKKREKLDIFEKSTQRTMA